jgi:O-antigen/teichoic acid export membrane protein
MLSGLLNTIWNEIYYIVIGKFYSSAQLGQYTRAQQFSTIFSSNLTTVIQRVSFPVLSTIQDDPIRLREGYRRIIKISMLVTFSCMLGLAAVAKPMILILIGEKWTPAITYLQIICLSSMLYPLHAINLNILQVKGRSDIFLKLEIIKKMIGVGPILLGVFYGIEPMLWGSVVTSIISYYLNSYYSAQMIQYSTWNQIKDILPTFFIASIVAIIMWSFTFFNLSMWLLIILQICIGIILALCLFEKTKLSEYNEIKGLVMNAIHHKTIK